MSVNTTIGPECVWRELMIKLYGSDGRSFRCAWMLEETEVDDGDWYNRCVGRDALARAFEVEGID